MNLMAAVKLLVAIARVLDIPASLLAESYKDDKGCQDYINEVIRLTQEEYKVPAYN